MTAAAMLVKEIETLPEESVAELLDFALFLRTKKTIDTPAMTKRKSMFGAFPGINTTIERRRESMNIIDFSLWLEYFSGKLKNEAVVDIIEANITAK